MFGLKLPAAHCVHDVFPVPAANDPASQSKHAASPLWFWYSPAGHSVHDVFPVPAAKDPAPQSRHVA